MVAIVLLNWNGWKDTIECIESIYESVNVEFSVIVVDNGSSDDSIFRIKDFIHKMDSRLFDIREGADLKETLLHRDIVLYELKNNYGFAKGNNLGLRLITGQPIDYYWILNNDTVIDPNALDILKRFMDDNEQYVACTPQIRYFSPNNRIWNCGGRLVFGFRKYYYGGAEDVVFRKNSFDISFVTGCALFVRPELLNVNNELFTEIFFFGEEDFELSLRLKKNKMKIACNTRSVIYHKVSASIKKKPKLSGIYIHYLNRYINIRHHFNAAEYFIWKIVSNLNLRRVLANNEFDTITINSFIKLLNTESEIYDAVTKELFESIINNSLLGENR